MQIDEKTIDTLAVECISKVIPSSIANSAGALSSIIQTNGYINGVIKLRNMIKDELCKPTGTISGDTDEQEQS